jgi:hypothetical protein
VGNHQPCWRGDAAAAGYFDRTRGPVTMDMGTVLDVEDVAGGKVCALASRVEPRDYADTAAMLGRYSPAELIGFARPLDPGLDATSPHCENGSRPGHGLPRPPKDKSRPTGRPHAAKQQPTADPRPKPNSKNQNPACNQQSSNVVFA